MLLAGPFSNIIFAVVVLLNFRGMIMPLPDKLALIDLIFFMIKKRGWFTYLYHVNVLVGLMNLLPIYPLDGAKIIHTLIAGRFHRLFTIAFVVCGLLITVAYIPFIFWAEIKPIIALIKA